MDAFLAALSVVLAYLIGSIPSAYILLRLAKGTDIRNVGTGNVGALNTFHQIGPAWAAFVLFADVSKGVIAVLLPSWIEAPDWARYVSAFSVVAGHNWPVFLGFRGGKGAATTLGVGLGLAPVLAAISFAPVILSTVAIRKVVIGVAGAFVLFSVLTIATSESWALIGTGLGLTVLVVGNYKARTIQGGPREKMAGCSVNGRGLGRYLSRL